MADIPIDPREQAYIQREETSYLKTKILRTILLCFLLFGIGYAIGHRQGTQTAQISAEEIRNLAQEIILSQADSVEEYEEKKKAAYEDGYWIGYDNGFYAGRDDAYKEGFDYGCYAIFEGMSEEEFHSWWDKNTDLIQKYDISS